jgi:hypothetical protein
MKINYKYLIKNLILNPLTLFEEINSDFKKDRKIIQTDNIKVPNKIWICGLPKSGTTLIEEILDQLLFVRIDRSVFRLFPNKDKLNLKNIDNYISSFPNDKFSYVKTHLKYSDKLLNVFSKNKFKLIVSFRDLRDTMISRYYHIFYDKNHWQHQAVAGKPFKIGFLNSLKIKTSKFPKNIKFEEPIVTYYNWILGWKNINNPDVKKINYETYLKNPVGYIQSIKKFTNCLDFDENKIHQKIISKISITKKISLEKKLKLTNKNVSTFRLGKLNQWKELFDKDIENNFLKSLPGDINKILI